VVSVSQAHFIRVKKKGTGAISGKPGRSGRKSFVATPEQRNNVKIRVGLGVPQAMICQLVVNPQTGKPLDEGTLKKHFRREIASSTAMAEASRRSPWSERHRIGGLSRRAACGDRAERTLLAETPSPRNRELCESRSFDLGCGLTG
jgi:hypothetical protein